MDVRSRRAAASRRLESSGRSLYWAWIAVCCVALCAAGRETPAEEQQSPSRNELEVPAFPETEEEDEDVIRYADGQLSADVADVSLRRLLLEVGRQSGAKVHIQGEDLTITDDFKRLPLDEAMRRLVKGRNFSLIYGKAVAPDGTVVGTRLKEINLYGAGKPASVRRTLRKTAPPVRPKSIHPPTREKRRAEPLAPRASTTAVAPDPGNEDRLVREPQEEEQPPTSFANPVTAAILGGPIDPDPVDDIVEEQPPPFAPLYEGDEDFPPDDQEFIYDDVTGDVYDDEPE